MSDDQSFLAMDLRNAATNLASWKRQPDSPFVEARRTYWRGELDRLLDASLAAHV